MPQPSGRADSNMREAPKQKKNKVTGDGELAKEGQR